MSEAVITTGEDWQSAVRKPAPALRPFVRRYQGWTERSSDSYQRREVPHGDVVLIVNFASPFLS